MGVTDILGHAKEISELIRAYNNQELYQKIVNLRDEILKLSEENLELKARVKELEQHEDIASQLVRDGNVYYRNVGQEQRNGPFCMACWDGDRKLVNVIVQNTSFGTTMSCGRCRKASGKG